MSLIVLLLLISVQQSGLTELEIFSFVVFGESQIFKEEKGGDRFITKDKMMSRIKRPSPVFS